MDIKDKLQSSNAEPLLKAVSSKLGIPRRSCGHSWRQGNLTVPFSA